VAKRARTQSLDKKFRVELHTGNELVEHETIVDWHILENGKQVGTLTFDRRLATQADFNAKPNEELLMSFNELYYIATPAHQGGWSIDPHQFGSKFKMNIKQLRKPVTKKMIENIAWVEENNLSFLRLGTEVK
jgi:hypothetical protein